MLVRKRNGTAVEFDLSRIVYAVEAAMRETIEGVNVDIAKNIAIAVGDAFRDRGVVTVEDIQDEVEDLLMKSGRTDVAKKYMFYRYEKSVARNKGKKVKGLLSEEFISKYKHLPNPMGQLGTFVFYRTYSRFLPDEGRREYWWETVRRAVEYNCSLVPATTVKEAEDLFDNVYNLRQFPSGRTFWVGGTDVSKEYPMSNYNCAFLAVDSFKAFSDVFYLLMLGSGVGVSITKKDVSKLPKVRTGIEVFHVTYSEVPKEKRKEYTELTFTNKDTAHIAIGDSKEGWIQALDYFFELHNEVQYRNINAIHICYDNVRPKGERLKKFGGTASGHESILTMFRKIDKLMKANPESSTKKLKPIDCLDIANIIGENVVSGGVRRSSEIALIDADDDECINAKTNLYFERDGKWSINKNISHRQMSNNSILYTKKPTRERLNWQIDKMRYSGEPAWINLEALLKRHPKGLGTNPCGEILMDSKGMCNLSTNNVLAFVNSDGNLRIGALLNAIKLSVRLSYRMTCVEMELHEWDAVLQRDKLIGVSLTGWQDMMNLTGMSEEDEIDLLKKLRSTAREEANRYASSLGQNKPLLVTTVKPEGTLSQLPTVSSGVHYSHSPYYVRRVRISSTDPLTKVCEELGYPVFPEVGQDINTCVTKVIEFPAKSPEGKTKYDISAIKQLENYKKFMTHYVDHNCSITVHVRNDEWDSVKDWVWENWDEVVGITFISLDDSFYQLMPYESITEGEYNKRVSEMKPFIPSLISKYEVKETEEDLEDTECSSGVCPIR
jgi:ribonucleoside-diphosphate reductase alpha chain/ribonucleoside-triphosphate reductase